MKNTQNNNDKFFWVKIILCLITMLAVIFGPRHEGAWLCANAQAPQVSTEDTAVETTEDTAVETKETAAPAKEFTFSKEDKELGERLEELFYAGTTPTGFCSLVTVVANEESWDRDLAVAYVGDLGGGASVLRRSHANEAGVVTFLVASNTKIELLEDNSFLGMSFYSRKASGDSLESFIEGATGAGYKVTVAFGNHISCTSKVRNEVLKKAVGDHQKAVSVRKAVVAELEKVRNTKL